MSVYGLMLYWVNEVPGHFKTHTICSEGLMENVPNHLKTQEMCDKAFEVWPWQLHHVPDRFKTQEMRNEAMRS